MIETRNGQERRSVRGPRAAAIGVRLALATLLGSAGAQMLTSEVSAGGDHSGNPFTVDLGGFNLNRYCADKYGPASRAKLEGPAVGHNAANTSEWDCTTPHGLRRINMQSVAEEQYSQRPIVARPQNPDGANTWHAFTIDKGGHR